MDHLLSAKAEALLNAHVAFMVAQLDANQLHESLVREVDAILANAPLLTLNECVTPEMIKETVHRYAVELELGAGVLDIIGDVARTIHGHEVHQHTTLNDLLPDHHFMALLDKVLEMKSLREHVVREVVANPVYSALTSDILYHGIRGYLVQSTQGNSKATKSLVKLGKTVLSKVPADIEASFEFNLRHYIQKSISAVMVESERFLLTIDEDKLRYALLDIWDDIKINKASIAQQFLTSLDVEEFFVLSYEFWREFRESDYFTVLINAGIDAFFNRYGDTTFDVLLEEVGIRRDMLIADAMRFVPPVVKVLKAKNLLEPMLRRQFESFYASPSVAAILAS